MAPFNPTQDDLENIEEESSGAMDDQTTDHDDEDGIQENKQEELKIAKKETTAVAWLRGGLLFALIGATLLVSLSVYYYTNGSEEQDFEDAFQDNSLKLVETFQAVAKSRLSAVASFGTSITSYALATNSTWPFVTIPDMQARSSHVMMLAESISILFSPIIQAKDRDYWENKYVPENIGWVQDGIQYRDAVSPPEAEKEESSSEGERGGSGGGPPPTYEGMPEMTDEGYSKQVYNYGPTPLGSFGPMVAGEEDHYIAWWQSAPLPRGREYRLINLDTINDPALDGRLFDILQNKKAAIGKMSIGSYSRLATGPTSAFYYPVFQDTVPETSPVVATLSTMVMWDRFLFNVLPQNADGLYAVIKNTCNQSYTFMVNGPEANYIGEGDLHDRAYDHMHQEVFFTTLIREGIEAGTYLGVPLDEDGCDFSLSVYASSEMENQYISNMPVYYMVSAILIFFFTSCVFVLYDVLVERRQRLVMREATKSGAIVSSLFPEAYRDRLMEAQEAEMVAKEQPQSAESKGSLLTSFMKGEDRISNSVADDEPIADLYENCTVFFADIAGFTAWSSTRDPCQVFTLLQTVYGAFDKVARKRKVFKVETIGDCYMCVAGLPNPQEQHALIMAKFAYDCLLKMNDATCGLVDKLGEGTEQLSLRIGLHSGPVTAGILRGEKSRFQLFGDTVNTASRMESTGQRNRIQVSVSTAELLKQSGKGHWLVEREGLTEMKGKGAVKTFWLVPDRTGSVATDATSFLLSKSMNGSTVDDSELSGELPAIPLKDDNGDESENLENRLMTRLSR